MRSICGSSREISNQSTSRDVSLDHARPPNFNSGIRGRIFWIVVQSSGRPNSHGVSSSISAVGTSHALVARQAWHNTLASKAHRSSHDIEQQNGSSWQTVSLQSWLMQPLPSWALQHGPSCACAVASAKHNDRVRASRALQYVNGGSFGWRMIKPCGALPLQ